MKLEGGCLCGPVRYEFSGDPLRHVICHCRDCQRASGSAFHVGVVIMRKDLKIVRGEPRTFRQIGESGRWIDRTFCPNCGSGLLHELELREPEYLVIKTRSLDNPYALVAPIFEIFLKSKLPWISAISETTKLDEMVPQPAR